MNNCTILNPPKPVGITYQGNDVLMPDEHSKFYGYLVRFYQWQRQVHLRCNRYGLTPYQLLSLIQQGEIKTIGWEEDFEFVEDYLALLQPEKFPL